MRRTLGIPVVVAVWSLACGAPSTVPATPGDGTIEQPAPRAGKRKGAAAGACQGGTYACSGTTLMFCEQGAFSAQQNCKDRGAFWDCFELGKGAAECREANGM